MTQTAYPYRKIRSKRYHFISVGKKRIEKAVEFIAIGGNIFNLAFGDLLPDGSIDDKAVSNNGDIVKVKDQFDATAFDPNTDWEYEAFLIKRIY